MKRTRVGLALLSLLICLFVIGGIGFIGAQNAAASTPKCARAGGLGVVTTTAYWGTVNPWTGECSGLQQEECPGGKQRTT